MMISCGLAGCGANLSVMTCLGGGGKTLPGIVMCFGPIGCGGTGGLSRTITGCGLIGSSMVYLT